MTKSQAGPARVSLDRNPRVEAYDNAFCEDGRFILTLAKGWAFDDAAASLEADPDGRYACHSHGFGSVAEALDRIRWASPCSCGRCSS